MTIIDRDLEIQEIRTGIVSVIENAIGKAASSPWVFLKYNPQNRFRFGKLYGSSEDVEGWFLEEHDYFKLPSGLSTADYFHTYVLYQDGTGKSYGSNAAEIWTKEREGTPEQYHREKLRHPELASPLTLSDYKRVDMFVRLLEEPVKDALQQVAES